MLEKLVMKEALHVLYLTNSVSLCCSLFNTFTVLVWGTRTRALARLYSLCYSPQFRVIYRIVFWTFSASPAPHPATFRWLFFHLSRFFCYQTKYIWKPKNCSIRCVNKPRPKNFNIFSMYSPHRRIPPINEKLLKFWDWQKFMGISRAARGLYRLDFRPVHRKRARFFGTLQQWLACKCVMNSKI